MSGEGLLGSGRGILDALDRGIGNGLELAVRAHHRRRLDRLGHRRVFRSGGDSLWADDGSASRPGNDLEILIDGRRAFSTIADALRGARSRVHIAAWHMTPDFRLERDRPETIRDVLAGLAERIDVRVLVWAGPPLPLFRPTRSDVRQVAAELTRGTRIRCALDARERTMHCHHEKLIVIDDEVAFVGGIDLTSLGGDRWDTNDHPAKGSLGWHDVASRLRGPAVADVAEHFRRRWQEVTGEPLPVPVAPAPAGAVDVQVLRTIPERSYRFAPRGEFGILDAYLRALRSAESLIYLENQFLWSTEIGRILAGKLRHPPRPEFRLVLVLPARPNNGADTTRGQLGCLMEADAGAGRLLAVTINSRTGDITESLYVHAKVGIVDDRWLTVGSANLNEHSLFNDTEMNVATCDAELARRTRLELWSEHLERPIDDICHAPHLVIDEIWRPIAEDQLRRKSRDQTLTHHLMRLPAVSHRAKRLVGPLRGLLVDG